MSIQVIFFSFFCLKRKRKILLLTKVSYKYKKIYILLVTNIVWWVFGLSPKNEINNK